MDPRTFYAQTFLGHVLDAQTTLGHSGKVEQSGFQIPIVVVLLAAD